MGRHGVCLIILLYFLMRFCRLLAAEFYTLLDLLSVCVVASRLLLLGREKENTQGHA